MEVIKSLQKHLEDQAHVKELAESNISYQELQKNYEQAMNNVKDILTLFDANRIRFFQFFRVKNTKKV
jgi:hypothetical protein